MAGADAARVPAANGRVMIVADELSISIGRDPRLSDE
jgi:hypothetical protein